MAVYLYAPANTPYRYSFCKEYATTASTALFHPINILLHPVRAVALHLVGYVAVYVQRKRRRSVSEISLHCLNVVPSTDGGNSERMPLGIIRAHICRPLPPEWRQCEDCARQSGTRHRRLYPRRLRSCQ